MCSSCSPGEPGTALSPTGTSRAGSGMCSPSLGTQDNFHINQSTIKTTKHERAPRMAEFPPHQYRVSSVFSLSIPGIPNPSVEPWFEAPGNSAAAPQFHQVTHTSSPLDFISSLAFSCKCYSAKVLRLPEHFWHLLLLLLLEELSVDETGQVPSLAGAGKRETAICTLDSE